MLPHFNKAEKAVHYPADRRVFVTAKPYMLIIFGIILLGLIGAAWLHYLFIGLPADPSASFPPITANDLIGFPMWVSISHWVNFFFLALIIRSELSILTDHPRLYWNNGCVPETEWK